MKRCAYLFGSTYLLLAMLFVSSPEVVSQDKTPEVKPVKAPVAHPRGRKNPTPAQLAKSHADARLRLLGRMRALPVITAASYDCRDHGLVPPIRDQGQCGSCWDFSGCGMITSAAIKAGYGKADGSYNFSEQFVLDCGSNGGCDGDNNTTVLDQMKTSGLATDDYGPYQARSGRCNSSVKPVKIKGFDWGYCTIGQTQGVANTQDIKNCMVAYGPIGSAVAAGGTNFWNTGEGTDTGRSNNIDHDVILVGWDDAHDNGDGSKGAWIMRNSWGTGWGNGGYAWVKYGADQIGEEAVWCTATPLVPLPLAPVVTSPLTATATAGTPWTYQITASNSPTMYGTINLPAGLTCNVTTGYLSGTPTTPVTTSVTLSASNATGAGTATLVLTVSGSPVPPTPIPPAPGTLPTITLQGTGTALDGVSYELFPPGTSSEVKKLIESAKAADALIFPQPIAPPGPCGEQAAKWAEQRKFNQAILEALSRREAADQEFRTILSKQVEATLAIQRQLVPTAKPLPEGKP